MASTDRDALVALLLATRGQDGWERKDNWDTDAELAEWYGVCLNQDGRVVKLDLNHNNLRGMRRLQQAVRDAWMSLSVCILLGPLSRFLLREATLSYSLEGNLS